MPYSYCAPSLVGYSNRGASDCFTGSKCARSNRRRPKFIGIHRLALAKLGHGSRALPLVRRSVCYVPAKTLIRVGSLTRTYVASDQISHSLRVHDDARCCWPLSRCGTMDRLHLRSPASPRVDSTSMPLPRVLAVAHSRGGRCISRIALRRSD